MIDFRLYRVAWLPAVAAFVMMMFSLEGIPEPPDPQVAPATFDPERAQDNLKEILRAGPERTPGSAGDDAVAEIVLERFEEIEAGTAATQAFETSVDGSDTELRNVILTLAGESQQVVLVMAARDSASGPGAASSAAATAALLELAEALGGTEHTKTFVIVSTAAVTEGALGAREFLDAFAERDQVESAVVLAQPGFREPRGPYVLRHSTDDRSTSMQLVRTAEEAVAEQAKRGPTEHGLFADLARLAVPVAVGEQGVLIAEGVDAIAISSAGERPLAPSEDTEAHVDTGVLGEFGAAALATVLVLDPLSGPLEHGPDSYVEFSGSLVPGWAIAVFALALLVPAAVAALDGIARAARRRAGEIRALAWAFGLALPLLGSLLLVYLMSVVGLIADPRYPFDPGRFGTGPGEVAVGVLLALTAVAGFALGGLARPPRRPLREALVPALGAAAVAGALASWLLNPYFALVLAPAAHLWLLAARERVASRVLLTAAALVALLPAALAVRSALGDVGARPWDLLLMIADGHVSAPALMALCPLAASIVGVLILAWRPDAVRTDDRGSLGARPQPQWGPADDSPEAASIDSHPAEADGGGEQGSLPP